MLSGRCSRPEIPQQPVVTGVNRARCDAAGVEEDPVPLCSGRDVTADGEPQLTAFFTSAAILASTAAVSFVTAKETGHISPSSIFALSLKPSVAYLVLNFCAGWKWQTSLPSLAYAGIPYQSLGVRDGALALMTEWSRSPRARSGADISAIFASTSLSASASVGRAPRRRAVVISFARSFIAARSSAVNPSALPLRAAPPRADGRFSVIARLLAYKSRSGQLSCYGAAVAAASSNLLVSWSRFRRDVAAHLSVVEVETMHAGSG